MEQWVSLRRGETIRMKQLLQTARAPLHLCPGTFAAGRGRRAGTSRPGLDACGSVPPARQRGWARGEGPWGAGWEGGTRGSWGPLRPQHLRMAERRVRLGGRTFPKVVFFGSPSVQAVPGAQEERSVRFAEF